MYRWILPLICSGIVIVLFQFTNFAFPDSFGIVADSSYLVVPGILSFLAITLAISLIKKRHIDAIPISLFATSMLCFFGGEQLWTIYKTIFEIEPFPSAADFFYLSAYPFFSAFFLYFMKANGKTISKKVVLFGVIISASLLYPTFLSTYEFNIEESSLSIAVALAYPVLDAVLLGMAAITTLVLFQEGKNYFWIMVNLGIFVWILTNTLFLYAIIDDTYYDGHPVDSLWLISFILWSFAAINYHNHIHNDHNYQLDRKKNDSKNITYQAIKQYVIPIFVGIIVMVSITALNFLGMFERLGDDQGNTATLLLIFAIMITFSGIILMVNKNLTALVKIRERELQEKNELLLKSERFSAIGEVSARIAHDIRNPLAVLKNSMEMMISRHEDHLSSSDNESIFTIKRAITRITHQVDDVLDYVREKKLEISEVEANALIKNVIADCPYPENTTIEVKPSTIKLRCDVSQMQRVFVNLLLNAAQSIKEGGKIIISTKEDNNWVHFEFQDDGPGIPNEISSKLFEPLVTSRQTGTGLGLAICKRIVEQHWGKINYKNNPTTFAVSLPRHL